VIYRPAVAERALATLPLTELDRVFGRRGFYDAA